PGQADRPPAAGPVRRGRRLRRRARNESMMSVAQLADRLAVLHRQTQEAPLFNPVFQLSLELSRMLESGELDLAGAEGLIAELECDALMTRAGRLRRLVAPVEPQANDDALAACLGAADFAEFRAAWERPQLHAVFTAHPTFLLTPAQSEAVASAAASEAGVGQNACAASPERPRITLAVAHGTAVAARPRAQG